MSRTYFAADGNYGNADGLLVLDTSKWTDEQWDYVMNASDDDRLSEATRMSSMARIEAENEALKNCLSAERQRQIASNTELERLRNLVEDYRSRINKMVDLAAGR
jgi:hypothetical protein